MLEDILYLHYETFRVHHPDPLGGFLLAEAFLGHGHDEQVCDTKSRLLDTITIQINSDYISLKNATLLFWLMYTWTFSQWAHLPRPLENKRVVCEFVLGDLQSGQDPGDGYRRRALMGGETTGRINQQINFHRNQGETFLKAGGSAVVFRTLDVVVERAVTVPVLVEDAKGVAVGKILELDQAVHAVPAGRQRRSDHGGGGKVGTHHLF